VCEPCERGDVEACLALNFVGLRALDIADALNDDAALLARPVVAVLQPGYVMEDSHQTGKSPCRPGRGPPLQLVTVLPPLPPAARAPRNFSPVQHGPAAAGWGVDVWAGSAGQLNVARATWFDSNSVGDA
jgi:hypothetical protein